MLIEKNSQITTNIIVLYHVVIHKIKDYSQIIINNNDVVYLSTILLLAFLWVCNG